MLSKFVACLAASFLIFLQITPAEASSDYRKRANQLEEGYNEADVQAEITFGREAAAKILGRHPALKNEGIQRYISLLGTGIALQIGRSELKYHFAILDMEDVNAYACPGGYIFITKGALQVMTSEAQLIGVLAHQIAHLDRRHVVKQLNIKGKDDSMTSGMAGILGGSSSSVRIAMDMLVNKAYSILFEEGISKEAELEADTDGILSMTTLGYDWKSYRNFINSLNQMIYTGHGKVLSKTHPKTEDRILEIDRFAKKNEISDFTGKINIERFAKYMQFEEISVAEDFKDFDDKIEISWGRELAARLLAKYQVVKDDALQKYVNLLGRGISGQVGRPELNYYFAVLDTDAFQAISFPGGYVFLSRGALTNMSNEAQLVGVLAREVAHINQQHLLQQVKIRKQTKQTNNTIRLPLSILADYALSLMEEEGLSAKFELESDALSIEMLTTVGFDWKSYRTYISRLSNLKHYPATNKRLETIDNTVTQIGLEDYEGKTNDSRFKRSVHF